MKAWIFDAHLYRKDYTITSKKKMTMLHRYTGQINTLSNKKVIMPALPFIWKISDYQFQKHFRFSKAFIFYMLHCTCLPPINFSFFIFCHYCFCVCNSKDWPEHALFFLNYLFFHLFHNNLNNNFWSKILFDESCSSMPLSWRGIDSKNTFLSRTLSPPHSFTTSSDSKTLCQWFYSEILTKFWSVYFSVKTDAENKHDKPFSFNQNNPFQVNNAFHFS